MRVFKTVSHLTTKLKEKYAELEPCRELRVGYMDPGHGWKGKQRWITCDEDLKDMYKVYSSKVEFLIWCFLPGKPENSTKKRKNPSANNDPAEKCTKCSTAIQDKMNEVKDISWRSLKVNMERNFHTMLGLSLSILESKNRMMNHLIILFLWDENRMVIRVIILMLMVQIMVHIPPVV